MRIFHCPNTLSPVLNIFYKNGQPFTEKFVKGCFCVKQHLSNAASKAVRERESSGKGKRGNMTSHEAAVYREIQKSTDMAMKAIDTISDKVHDDALAMQISRQTLKYSELHNKATRQLLDARTQGYQSSALSDVLLRTGLHYNTILNTSTGHIAELMIKNSTNGILEMEKVLKHHSEAGSEPLALAKQLIEVEEKNVERLKQYL